MSSSPESDTYANLVEESHQQWNKLCPGIDEVLGKCQKQLGGSTECCYDGLPTRVLRWQNQRGDEHTISMILNPEGTLQVWATIWNDSTLRPIDRRTPAIEEQLTTPVEADQFQRTINELKRRLAGRSGAATRRLSQ